MKAIVDGKFYDTETATLLGEITMVAIDIPWSKKLFKKKNGEFFELESIGKCNKINPISIEKAKQWAEKHLSVESYIEIFGPVEE